MTREMAKFLMVILTEGVWVGVEELASTRKDLESLRMEAAMEA